MSCVGSSPTLLPVQLALLALTAAGAEKRNYDGNRMCAQFGRLMIELYMLNNADKAGVSPSRCRIEMVFPSLTLRPSCGERLDDWRSVQDQTCCCSKREES
jgi:hypothetical protein